MRRYCVDRRWWQWRRAQSQRGKDDRSAGWKSTETRGVSVCSLSSLPLHLLLLSASVKKKNVIKWMFLIVLVNLLNILLISYLFLELCLWIRPWRLDCKCTDIVVRYMYKSSSVNDWFNLGVTEIFGEEKKTCTQEKLWSIIPAKLTIAYSYNCTSPLHNLQHGMTSLCIFWTWAVCMWLLLKPLTAIMAGTSSSSLFFSVGFLAAGCITFVCFTNVSGVTEITQTSTFLCNNPSNYMPKRLRSFLFFLHLHEDPSCRYMKSLPYTATQGHVPPIIQELDSH